jgi:uncharacterized delta-60 repeat protein
MNMDSCRRVAVGVPFFLGLIVFTLSGALAQEKGNDDGKQKAKVPAGLSIALDPTFGYGGFVADLFDAKNQVGALGRFLTVDRQGRPVIAGNTPGQRFAVGRYTKEGRPDTTFAGSGKSSVCIEDEATVKAAGNAEVQFTHGGAIDAKGRLVVIGKGGGIGGERQWDFALLRFAPDGTLDKTFSEVGFRKYQAHESWNIGLSVAIAPDCSTLVAAGYAQPAGAPATDPLLIRFTEAGAVDEAFTAAANGSLRWLVKDGTPAIATGVAIDQKGRYLVGMNTFKNDRATWALARLKADGEFDDSFGEGGLWSEMLDPEAATEQTFSTTVDAAGRTVMGGYSDNGNGVRRLAVARINERGQSDAGFGPEGKGHLVLSDYGADVTYRYGPRAAVSNNRIAIEGSVNGAKGGVKCFGVAVIDESGKSVAKIEPRLFPGSKGTDQPWGIAFDGEDRIVVGGGSQAISGKWRFAVARYVVK